MNTEQNCIPSTPGEVSPGAIIHSKRSDRVLTAVLALQVVTSLLHADETRLRPEQAPTVDGPWTRPTLSEMAIWPDGSLSFPTNSTNRVFRLALAAGEWNDPSTPLLITDRAPDQALAIAQAHLAESGAVDADGQDGWAGAQLAPYAFKIYDPSYRDGKEPAYIEFKVYVPRPADNQPIKFLADPDQPADSNRGYILVSLTNGDAPVPEFNTDGITPCERLVSQLATLDRIKILRFGATFMTAEDGQGQLLANIGSQPVRPPAEATRYLDISFAGNFDSERNTDPEPGTTSGPKLALEPYGSYEDFKRDYLSNPVYQAIRERLADAVKGEWDILAGGTGTALDVLTVGIDRYIDVLAGQRVTQYFLDSGTNAPIANIAPLSTGGLRVTGLRTGSADLNVKTSDGLHKFYLEVGSSIIIRPKVAQAGLQSFAAGWQPANKWYVTTYAETPRYWQTKNANWCPVVGCGPVAWAMLLGWWDHKGVPAAFSVGTLPGRLTSSKTVDAPLILDKYADYNGYQRVQSLYSSLYNYCDVICAFGNGATPPGDMVDAIYPQTYIERKISLDLGMSYSWAWDLVTPGWAQPSSVARNAILNGRPAVLGLGWLWHYALAYGYLYQEYKLAPGTPPTQVRRWFRCNEGWGKTSGAWYSGYHTFLGADVKFWQK